jgi:hypothetical protein
MTLSDEQRDIILQDFLDIFQARYGEQWRTKLTSNLRPSPIHQIAEQRGVKVSDVKKVRSQLLAIGQVFQLISTMTQPLEPTQAPFEFHYAN